MHAICTGLAIHPVKGGSVTSLNDGLLTGNGIAAMTEAGLVRDRGWAVWNPDRSAILEGYRPLRDVLTQRELPALSRLKVSFNGGAVTLSLRNSSFDPLTLSVDELTKPTPIRSTVWGAETPGLDLGDRVGKWLGRVLLNSEDANKFRLVKFDESRSRARTSRFSTEGRGLPMFGDGFSYHTLSDNALDELNRRISARAGKTLLIGPDSFRSNIRFRYPDGVEEDQVEKLSLAGLVQIDYVKPCTRCFAITVDQNSGVRLPAGEPFATLKKYRSIQIRSSSESNDWKEEVAFGWNGELAGTNLRPTDMFPIRVGDSLEIKTRETPDLRWEKLPTKPA